MKSMSNNEDHTRWIAKIFAKYEKDPKSVKGCVMRMAMEGNRNIGNKYKVPDLMRIV